MIDFTGARKKLEDRFTPQGPGNPPNSYRASMVGRPCARYLYYARDPLAWETQKPFDAQSAFEMARGRENEHKIIELAMDATEGMFDQWIYNKRLDDEDPRLECYDTALDIRGKVDALARHKETGQTVVFEAKHCSTFVFEQINSAEDIKTSETHWLLAWYGALQAYLYNKGLENGCWILGAKQRTSGFPIKFIPISFDYEWFQGPIDRIGIAQQARKAGHPPDPIPYTSKGCGQCSFLEMCGNAPQGWGAPMMLRPDIAEILDQRAMLKPAADTYEKLDKQAKEALKGIEKARIGNYYITGSVISRKGYMVKDTQYWKCTIDPIVGD